VVNIWSSYDKASGKDVMFTLNINDLEARVCMILDISQTLKPINMYSTSF